MEEKTLVQHPLEPVKDKESKILILGSFPSVKSREAGFYYMNKNNRFYKVLSKLLNEEFYHTNIEHKIYLLNKHHIALYDVVTSCFIKKSEDSSIKVLSYLDLELILNSTKIIAIFFNENKAFELFCQKFKNCHLPLYLLPSTSSANCKLGLEELTQKWEIITNFIK